MGRHLTDLNKWTARLVRYYIDVAWDEPFSADIMGTLETVNSLRHGRSAEVEMEFRTL